MAKGSALDRLRKDKKPAFERIPICMNSAYTIRLQKLEGLVNRKRTKAGLPAHKDNAELHAELVDLEEQLEEARATARAHSEWFEVRALPPDEYDDLLDEHAPTPDQIKKARKTHGPKTQMEFNPDTFPDALIAACTYVLTQKEKDGEPLVDENGDPVFDDGEQLTPEFVKEMRSGDGWNAGEILALYNAAYSINASTGNINAAGNV